MSRAPRILMFAEQFLPRIGGAERQALKLSGELVERGCKVEVLTPQHESDWPVRETMGRVPVNRFRYLDLTRRLKGIRGLGMPNAVFGYWQVRRALTQVIGDFDIVHGHIACPMVVYAMHVAQSMGKPAICKIALSGDKWDLAVLESTSLLGPRLARDALTNMNAWIAISRDVRQQLLGCRVEPERIWSIPNGVVIPDVASGREAAQAHRFLYLGRLGGKLSRDFETLLSAFNEVARMSPDCELAFVGGGEREAELRKALDGLPHARPRTRFVGFADPAPWLDWADVVVQPSLAEGMSNALLEAMAAGVCCIANDIPANREVLADGRAGILVKVGDVGDLAAAMQRLVTVPGECATWALRGRKHAIATYSIGHVADQYLTLYRDLLS